MAMSSQRTLLEAVRHLHVSGYESVRVHAYLYATGHWRCELGQVRSPVRDSPHVFGYSSAGGWDYFGDGAGGPIAPEELARSMLERLPGVAALSTPATAHVVWFSALLDHCGPDGIFILSDDCGYDAMKAGYVRLLYATAESADASIGSRFPISPLF